MIASLYGEQCSHLRHGIKPAVAAIVRIYAAYDILKQQ